MCDLRRHRVNILTFMSEDQEVVWLALTRTFLPSAVDRRRAWGGHHCQGRQPCGDQGGTQGGRHGVCSMRPVARLEVGTPAPL